MHIKIVNQMPIPVNTEQLGASIKQLPENPVISPKKWSFDLHSYAYTVVPCGTCVCPERVVNSYNCPRFLTLDAIAICNCNQNAFQLLTKFHSQYPLFSG